MQGRISFNRPDLNKVPPTVPKEDNWTNQGLSLHLNGRSGVGALETQRGGGGRHRETKTTVTGDGESPENVARLARSGLNREPTQSISAERH